MNRVQLIGKLMAVDGNQITIETTQTTSRGTFTESHEITCEKEVSISAGSMVKIKGSLQNAEEGGNHFILAHSVKKAKKSDESQNWAQVVGKLVRSFEFYGRSEGKQPFGNLLLMTGDSESPTFHRGVVFQYLANKFANTLTRGSTVDLTGRIRHREFTDSEGNQRQLLEIVGDHELTNIVALAETLNPFAGDEDAESEKAAQAV